MKDPAAKFLEKALSTDSVTLDLRLSKGLSRQNPTGACRFMAFVESSRSSTPEFFPCQLDPSELGFSFDFLAKHLTTGKQVTATGRMVHGDHSTFLIESLTLALQKDLMKGANQVKRTRDHDSDSPSP
jgi:hypothetical protein